MKVKKITIFMMILLVLLISINLTGLVANAADKNYTLHFAHAWAVSDNPYHNYVAKFKETAEKLSEGRIKIIEHPALELGDEREYIEAMQMGTLDLAVINTSIFSTFSDCLDWTALYFVITSNEQAERAFNDPLAIAKMNEVAEVGLAPLGYLNAGPRGIFTVDKPVNSLADLKNLKIRIMEAPIHVAAWEAMGTNPTPLIYSELYSALEYGTVDGAENPISGYKSVKFYEPAPHFAFSNHQWNICVALASKKVWDTLDSEAQEILLKAADEALNYNMQTIKISEKKDIEELEKLGVTFTYPDLKEFAELVIPAMEPWETSVGKDFVKHLRDL